MTWLDVVLLAAFSLGGLGIGVCWLICLRISLEVRRSRKIHAARTEKQGLLEVEMRRAEREPRTERQP